MHETTLAFAGTAGPRDAHVVLVGESWGEQEDLTGIPFIGNAGQELSRLLNEAGLRRSECLLTNVFPFRPYQGEGATLVKSNVIQWLCGKREEVGREYKLAPLRTGEYVRPEFLGEVNRLREEILAHPRNLVVALGAVACWALTGRAGIGAQRGAIVESTLCPGVKVLPTYHPSYLFKMWEHRPIVLADLMKAAREAHYPDIRRPQRWVLVQPSLDEAREWWREHEPTAEYLSIDLEWRYRQISIFGVAVSPEHALVLPFADPSHASGSYWPTLAAELDAWRLVETICADPRPKVFQNGLADMQYIVRLGIRVANASEDTMLLHHALYPELQKGLGFLGSIYTNEPPWKLMRHGKEDEAKRDE